MKFLRLLVVFGVTAFILSSCQKELDFNPAASAVGTLKATSGDCLPVTIYGTYQKDTLLNFRNTVDVQIDVAQVGSYNITTDTINGYSFSASGYAGVTGLSTIHLQAKGRPILPEVDVFNVKFDSSHCEINIIVTGTGGTASTDSITADINGTHETFNITDTAKYDDASVPGYHVLNISGLFNGADDKDFFLGVGLPGTAIPVAGTTYNVNQYPANFTGGAYQDNVAGNIYFAAGGFGTAPTPVFQITINTITASKVTGTFQGALPDAFGVLPDLQVTNGKFSVTIYP